MYKSINAERLLQDLADAAISAQSASAFRECALHILMQATGADAGTFHSAEQRLEDADGAVLGVGASFTRLQAHLNEISGKGVQWARPSHMQQDTDVVSASRRGQLSLYRDFLSEFGLTRHAVRGFLESRRFCFLTLSRVRVHDRRRFLGRATRMTDAAVPILILGESVHGSPSSNNDVSSGELRASLTVSEAKVVDLLERGLTNREIAALLGLSPNTVRNRVASAFARVGASRRAELVYLLQGARRLRKTP